MGFKKWFQAQKQRSEEYNAGAAFRAHYGTHSVDNGIYDYLPDGKFKKIKKPVAGATAEFDKGSDKSSATVGRVAAGAIIAGPVGAIVGGMFKKQKGRVYVYVTFPDGDMIILDGPVKDETRLRQFAATVNRAGQHFS